MMLCKRLGLSTALLGVVLGAAGCPSWLFDRGVPEGVVIGCQTDDDCPQGEGAVYTCVTEIGECVVVQTDGDQLEATGSVSPAAGGLGTVFTIDVSFSSELLAGTEATIQVRAADGTLHGTTATDTDGSWTFTPVEGEVAGGAAEIVVSARGAGGSVLTRVPVATFALDFTAPALLGAPSLDRERIGDNTSVTVGARFTEELGPPARLTVEGQDVSVEGSLADGEWSFVLSGEGLPEGPAALRVQAEDAAGNQSGPLPVGEVTVDRTPPSPPAVQTEARHLANGLIQVRLTFDEAVVADGAVLEGRDGNDNLVVFQSAGSADTEALFTRSPSAVPVPGTYSLSLTGIVDEAGNGADFDDLATIDIDGAGPTLAAFEASTSAGDTVTEADPPGTLLSAQPGDTLTVSLTFSEALSETPVVTVGSVLTLAASGDPVADPVGPYVFTTTLDSGVALEGEYNLTVSALDALGNQSVLAPLVVAIDTAPPQLVDVRFTPPAVAEGGTAILTVTANEALSGPPTVTWEGDLSPAAGFPTFIASGFTWTATLDVGTADSGGVAPGNYAVTSVALQDQAGNGVLYVADAGGADGGVADGGADNGADSEKLPATLVVDNQPIVIENINLSGLRFSAEPGYNTIGVGLQLDEAPGVDGLGDALLSVSLASSVVPFDCVGVGDALTWACTYDVVGDELGAAPEGPAPIDIELVDAAGNVTTDRRVVVLDFLPPQMTNPTLSPTLTNGDPVTLVFSVNEDLMGGAPGGVSFSPAVTDVTSSPSGLTFFYEIDVGSLADGAYALAGVLLEDTVGNSATFMGPPSPTFTVDTASPSIDIVSVSPSRLSAVAGYDDLTATLDLGGEAAGGATLAFAGGVHSLPSLLLDGTCAPAGGDTYSCTLEGAGALGPPSQEVSRQLVLEVVDDAGNRSIQTEAVVVDRQAPSLVGSGVTIVPDVTNPLSAPTALAASSTLQVSVALSEPVAPLAYGDARVVCPGGNIPLCPRELPNGTSCDDPYSPGDLARLLVGQASPGVEGAACQVQATIVDEVGNQAVVGGGAIRVDQTPPSAAELDPSAARHVRVPYGATVNGDERAHYLVAESWDGETLSPQPASPGVCPGPACIPSTITAPATETIAAIIVESAFGPVGQAMPDASGDWPPIRLSTVDEQALYLVPVDAAGNRGTGFALVDAADWIGSLGGKDAGSTFSNPHRYTYRTSQTDRLSDPSATELGAAEGIGSEDGFASTVFYEDGYARWVERKTDNPPPREAVEGVWDSGRQEMFIFGGLNITVAFSLADHWAFDERGWRLLEPEGTYNPPARQGGALAYDEARRRVVLFGGSAVTDASYISDVCEWDGERWEVPASAPSPRAFSAFTYHRGIGASVLFGGKSPGALGDTYLYRGGAFTLCDAGGSQGCVLADPEGDGNPAARAYAASAYDDVREEVVLFGGRGGARYGDTWVFNGSSWRRASTGGPSAREHAAMAFDRERGVMVLYGGRTANTTGHLAETWEWNGTSWSQVTPTDPEGDGNPPTLSGHAMAYDDVRDRVILTQGRKANSGGDDHGTGTWAFDGTSWELLRDGKPVIGNQQEAPTALANGAMAYDSARDRLVLFGGYTVDAVITDDTWEWTGAKWEQRSPATSPSPRDRITMAYDSVRGEVVLFGGRDFGDADYIGGDTWVYDGTTWTERTPVTNPTQRQFGALAFDERRGVTVMFGGMNSSTFANQLSDTWEWNGTNWTQITPSDPEGDGNPQARAAHKLVWDPARGVVVLFGGTAFEEDIWEWNGTSWAQRSWSVYGGFGPGFQLQQAALVYEPVTRQVVSFGGTGPFGPNNFVASWNGYGWHDHSQIVEPLGGSPPSPRRGLTGATDTRRNEAVVFGGLAGVIYSDETWVVKLDAEGRPAHVAQFDVAAAQRPDPQSCFTASCSVERVRTRFVGAARQTSPTSVLLYDVGSSGSNLVGTFGVDLTPNEPLSTLDGIDPEDGVFWKLVLEDTILTVEGTLNQWCVSTNGEAPVCSSPSRLIPEGYVIEEVLRTDPPADTSQVEIFVDITHQYAYDLDIRLEASTADPGAVMSVWRDGRFEPVASHGSTTPTSLTWETTDPDEIARLFPGPERTFSVALEPQPGAPSPAGSSLQGDYVELSLRYRASGL